MATFQGEAQFSTLYAINTFGVLTVTTQTLPDSNQTRLNYKLEVEVRNWREYAWQQWIASSTSIVDITIGGTRVSPRILSWRADASNNTSGYAKATVAEGSTTISHNSNGVASDRSVVVNFTPNVQPISNQPKLTMSTNVTFDTIVVDEKSNLSNYSTSFKTNSNYTWTIANSNSRASGYKHRINLYLGGSNQKIGERVGTGNVSVTIPQSFDSYISGVSRSGTLYLYTYSSSGSLIGTSSYAVTVSSSSGLEPSLSNYGHYVSEQNAKIGNLSIGNNFVSGQSQIKVVANDSAVSYKYGATKSSYTATLIIGGVVAQTKTFSGTTTTFTGLASSTSNQSGSIRLQVTDSRGQQSPQITIATFTMYGYSAPSASGSARRNESNQTVVNATVNYSYSPITYNGAVQNRLSLSLQYKETNTSTTYTATTSTFTSSSETWTPVKTNLSTSRSYIFQVAMNDGITETTFVLGTVGTESVPIDVSTFGVGIGKVHSESNYHLEIASGGILNDGPIKMNNVSLIGKDNVMSVSNNYGYIDLGPTSTSYANISTDRSMFQFNKGANFLGDIYSNGQKLGGTPSGSDLLNALLSVDGSGSRLDADLLDGKHASAFATMRRGSTTNGYWYQIGNLLICHHQMVLNKYYSGYTLTGTWTFPKSFSMTPAILQVGRTSTYHMSNNKFNDLNGTIQTYDESSTSATIAWIRQGSGQNFVDGDAKYITVIAIGVAP